MLTKSVKYSRIENIDEIICVSYTWFDLVLRPPRCKEIEESVSRLVLVFKRQEVGGSSLGVESSKLIARILDKISANDGRQTRQDSLQTSKFTGFEIIFFDAVDKLGIFSSWNMQNLQNIYQKLVMEVSGTRDGGQVLLVEVTDKQGCK